MRVFVTGASGWIGSAVVPELIGAGHEVLGLARSDASARALTAAGAEVQRGDVDDDGALREAAGKADAVIHLAFKHDLAFSGNFQGAVDADRRTIELFGAALAGSDRPFLIASGTLGLTGSGTLGLTGSGAAATEADGLADSAAGRALAEAVPRLANAHLTLALVERGVRASVVRLPPTVHGAGDQGFLAMVIAAARQHGFAGYLGDGSNRWPAVHVQDAARVFRLGLEQAPAGSVLHAVGDEGVALRAVAEVIGRQLGLPVAAVPDQAAGAHFGWLAGPLGLDNPTSAARTQELLGWTPTGPGLLEDLAQGHYFG